MSGYPSGAACSVLRGSRSRTFNALAVVLVVITIFHRTAAQEPSPFGAFGYGFDIRYDIDDGLKGALQQNVFSKFRVFSPTKTLNINLLISFCTAPVYPFTYKNGNTFSSLATKVRIALFLEKITRK
jgi:hypothetical protein